MFFYSPAPVQNLRWKQEQIRRRHHSQPQRRGFALSFRQTGAFQDAVVKPVNAIRRQQDRDNHNQKRRRIFKGVEAKAVTDRLQRIRFMGACNHKRGEQKQAADKICSKTRGADFPNICIAKRFPRTESATAKGAKESIPASRLGKVCCIMLRSVFFACDFPLTKNEFANFHEYYSRFPVVRQRKSGCKSNECVVAEE